MTKQEFNLEVQPRQITGRKVKTLRRQNIVPGNVFGNKIKSVAVQVNQDEFLKVFSTAGETSIVELTIEGKKENPVLITNVHKDPVTDQILHVDFRQIDLTQKVTANIPLELTGVAPAAEELDAVIVQLLNEVEVEALPTDLPDHLEVNIESLKEFNDSIAVKDIKVSDKVEIKNDPEQPVVQAQEPKEEEIEEPAPAEGEEGAEAPAEGEEGAEAPAEGETPAEDNQ